MDLLALQALMKLLSLELRLKITILQPIILYLPWSLNQKRLLKTHIGPRVDPHTANYLKEGYFNILQYLYEDVHVRFSPVG